jgi:hypothetical protein
MRAYDVVLVDKTLKFSLRFSASGSLLAVRLTVHLADGSADTGTCSGPDRYGDN